MNKRIFFLIALFFISGTLAYFSRTILLKSQVLNPPSASVSIPEPDEQDCAVLPETLANACFQKKALKTKNRSFCENITKSVSKADCKREIDLLPSP